LLKLMQQKAEIAACPSIEQLHSDRHFMRSVFLRWNAPFPASAYGCQHSS
jgi:hypothetical protein